MKINIFFIVPVSKKKKENVSFYVLEGPRQFELSEYFFLLNNGVQRQSYS